MLFSLCEFVFAHYRDPDGIDPEPARYCRAAISFQTKPLLGTIA
jgi:hypothetical protein